MENVEKQRAAIIDLLNQGYDFCKRLPDNAPGQDLILTPLAPSYLYKGDKAVAVYHDGRTESYKPVYNPLPPAPRHDTLDFD